MKTIIIVCILCLNMFFIDNAYGDEKLRSIDYQEVNNMLRFIKEKTHSPYITIDQSIVINSESLSFSDVKLWLTRDNNKQEIAIDADGKIVLPLLTDDAAKETTLDINQQKDNVSINLTTGINVPQQKEVPYKKLFVLLEDTNNFMSEMAGAAAWFVPSMDAMSFTFEQPATITISSKKKNYYYETDDELNIEISIKRKLMKENPTVVFSVLPTDMTPVD